MTQYFSKERIDGMAFGLACTMEHMVREEVSKILAGEERTGWIYVHKVVDRALSSEEVKVEEAELIDATAAASAFRDSMTPRADSHQLGSSFPLWHGWVIFDAFMAGVDWLRRKNRNAACDAVVKEVDEETHEPSTAYIHGLRNHIRNLMRELEQEKAKTDEARHSASKALYVLENWDYYKECSCRELAQDGRICEKHMAIRLIRSALGLKESTT